jgi:hypothetical protein
VRKSLLFNSFKIVGAGLILNSIAVGLIAAAGYEEYANSPWNLIIGGAGSLFLGIHAIVFRKRHADEWVAINEARSRKRWLRWLISQSSLSHSCQSRVTLCGGIVFAIFGLVFLILGLNML